MPTSTATAEPALLTGSAPDGWIVGVAGGPDPRRELERRGLRPTFSDHRIALAGPVCITDDVVVGGRMVLDADGLAATSVDPSLSRAASVWARGGAGALMNEQGMFGASVYDRQTGAVTLVRDPLGERTMYVASPPGSQATWFSDRLTTLRTIGAAGGELNLSALRDYLIYAYVPGTQTMYRDAWELAPGTSLDLESQTVEQHWEPVEAEGEAASFADNAARLRDLLRTAVRSRRQTGPVGVYLSGGVDSSAVTALLCEDDPRGVHTIAVHFGAELPNELPFVDQVVRHCRPQHHSAIELTSAELAEALPATMAALDDPIGDPLTVPNLALGRKAAELAPIVFNGEGGDPVFGGPKNQPMLLANLYGTSEDLDTVYLRSYQKCFGDLDRLLRPEIHAALAESEPPQARVARYLSEGDMEQFLNRLLLANTRLKGSDHILTKVANLTAAAGLIGRSPLFDPRVVEAAFAMPARHKLDGTVEKAVLKAAMTDLLPQTIIDRPKAGMRVPVQTWFRGPLRREGSKRLLSRRARIAPYLDRRLIKEWTRYDGDPQGRYGRKLWLLLSLEAWMEAHDVH